jgi:Xaa-Pro aminopeptidase
MSEAGVDALIATSPVNITYFTDYFSWLDPLMKEYMTRPGASSDLLQSYAVLPLEGDPALVVPPLFAVNAAELWVRDLYTFGDPGMDFPQGQPSFHGEREKSLYRLLSDPQPPSSPTDALLDALRDRGLDDARLGIELDGLPERTRGLIAESLPGAELKDCSNLLRLIRAVKSQDEIDRLRRAAEISEVAAMEALQEARPGRPISECIRHYKMRIGAMGANFDHFAYTPRGMGIATEPEYTFGANDVMYVDFGCSYRQILSDSGTTLALGAWSGELERTHSALLASVEAGVAALRPGARASSVQRAMQEALVERGHPGGTGTSFPHGHSLGLEVRDYPMIMPASGLPLKDACVEVSSDLEIEPDMVINLEAPVFRFGDTSLHVEQTFLMTERGAEPLLPQERARPVRP